MITFKVNGSPVAQPRPRVFKDKMGKSRAVNSSKSVNYKRLVKITARNEMVRQHIQMTDKPVALDICFVFTPPKSYTKKKLKAIETGELLYTKKGDIDNLVKGVMDSMNQVVYKDDAQVVTLSANKEYGKTDHVLVKVTEI